MFCVSQLIITDNLTLLYTCIQTFLVKCNSSTETAATTHQESYKVRCEDIVEVIEDISVIYIGNAQLYRGNCGC